MDIYKYIIFYCLELRCVFIYSSKPNLQYLGSNTHSLSLVHCVLAVDFVVPCLSSNVRFFLRKYYVVQFFSFIEYDTISSTSFGEIAVDVPYAVCIYFVFISFDCQSKA